MSKLKLNYVCRSCGAAAAKWAGQCADCGGWNTFDEMVTRNKTATPRQVGYAGVQSSVLSLQDIAHTDVPRFSTEFAELDRVLGGGLVAGSVVLIGGDPGIGKSTLLLQVLCKLSHRSKVLYITGEESLQQVAFRAQRLKLSADQLALLAETDVEQIIHHGLQQQPQVMVIDSIQTIFTAEISSAAGSVSQVRESAAQLVKFAKQHNVALFLVGHVTKEGALAGPRVLEHMVDTVLYFEGEKSSRFRIIRAIKNRFGAVNELGIFAMTEDGLKTVNNPSAIFLSKEISEAPGSTILVTWEGSRPMLVEVQALVDESHLDTPRRVTLGLEHNRLAMLLAVLHRHAHIVTYNQDVFINVVGGVRISETAIDLALIFAVVSSLRNVILPRDLVMFGEVGLAGELRPVQAGVDRLQEARKHGFKRAIFPKGNLPKQAIDGLTLYPAQHLEEALQYFNKF